MTLLDTFYSLLTRTDSAAPVTEELFVQALRSRGAPLYSPSTATFFWIGEASGVSIVGDWSYWHEAQPLSRIEGTSVWYAIVDFPSDALLQYKIIADGQWILDELNPRRQQEGFGINSELCMPGYTDKSVLRELPAWRSEYKSYRYTSKVLGTVVPVTIGYPSVPKSTVLAALVVADGEEARSLGRFDHTVDVLQSTGKIPPMVSVYVTPTDRNKQYAADPLYEEFLALELPIFVEQESALRGFTLSHAPHSHCITGASLGGLLATRTSLRFPSVYGRCLAQSPSYWWNKGELYRSPLLQGAENVRLTIQTGTICDAQQLARMMVQRLKQLNVQVQYKEYSQGHTWGNWRSNFAEGIQLAWNSH